jgi:hypothetical protein
MGKEESTQLVVKNVDFDDFKEYVEQDFIEELSQQGILFLSDRYSLKLLNKVAGKIIADPGRVFRGGYINEIGNDVHYNLSTYKKLGFLQNIFVLITHQSYHEYLINIGMKVSRASLDRNSLKVVLSPTPFAIAGKKGEKKMLIVIGAVLVIGVVAVFLATLLIIVFPPAILIVILAAILTFLILPFVIIDMVKKNRIIKKGKDQLIDAIQELIESNYQIDM